MTVPGKKARRDPNAIIRGAKINTYIGMGMASCVQVLNREKAVRGLKGGKSHVHPKPGPDPRSVFQKVKAHGAIERENRHHYFERARMISLAIDSMPARAPQIRSSLLRYAELIHRLTPTQQQELIRREAARGVKRCSIVLKLGIDDPDRVPNRRIDLTLAGRPAGE